jgi:two-component system, cell cycle response regulator DivK
MQYSISVEQLAAVLNTAQSLAHGSSRHESELEALVNAADAAVRAAQGAFAAALVVSEVSLDSHRETLATSLLQSVESAKTARRLCHAARQQRVAAGLLIEHLDDAPNPTSDLDPPLRVGAVLVVDDCSDNRELAAMVLRTAGFVVHTAANGLEGLLAAYDMRPAVIVMDVTMPVLDGIHATRLIKAAAATRHSRVIAYTGTPPGDAAVQDLFAAVLTKPVSPASLVETVRHVASL